MYELYEFFINENGYNHEELDSSFQVGIFKPSLLNLCIRNEGLAMNLKNLYWFLITIGRFKIYYISKDGEIIHTSYCLNKNYKFPFMKSNDIQIGPCKTDSNFRGLGLYPFMLDKITRDFHQTKRKIFMIIRKENISSIRGASKVGFRKTKILTKSKYMKIYKIAIR